MSSKKKTNLNTPKDLNKFGTREERKAEFEKAKKGESKNKQYNSLAKNLIPINQRPLEEQKAIRRKGWESMMAIKGERKNAKQILDEILPLFATNDVINDNDTIPKDIKQKITKGNIKITQYDLVMLSMLYKAQNGDYKSAEFIRDTYGDKPINENHNINDTMSQADKDLINKLAERMGINADTIDVDG